MSRHSYDSLPGSPTRQSMSNGSPHPMRTASMIEVRALLKAHGSNAEEFQQARKSKEDIGKIKNKKTRQYYDRQNELVR